MTIEQALPLVLMAAVAIGAIALDVFMQRAAERREMELLKLIRNLQNRLQARSFAEYAAMDDRESRKEKPAEAVTEELVHEVLSNRFTPADGLNM